MALSNLFCGWSLLLKSHFTLNLLLFLFSINWVVMLHLLCQHTLGILWWLRNFHQNQLHRSLFWKDWDCLLSQYSKIDFVVFHWLDLSIKKDSLSMFAHQLAKLEFAPLLVFVALLHYSLAWYCFIIYKICHFLTYSWYWKKYLLQVFLYFFYTFFILSKETKNLYKHDDQV